MNLKNYTSTVPASVTIGRIQNKLIEARVSSISMDYSPNGAIAAITFAVQISSDRPPIAVRLPANIESAQDAFWSEYVGNDRLTPDGQKLLYGWGKKKKCRADFREQAERTAWKIVQDWVEVQLTMIALRQADFVQVFLPYVWDGKHTFYQRIKDGGYLALGAPKEEPTEV